VNSTIATFTPTDEFQVVPDGAALPPGCEIVMDFATGQNRARWVQHGGNGHSQGSSSPAPQPAAIGGNGKGPIDAATLFREAIGGVVNNQTPGQPAEPPPPPRYIIHRAAEALRPQEPIDWVVERLYSTATINLLVGPGGTKKTRSVLDCGVCVATGVDWLGFLTKQTPVLYIDEESGPRRFARWLGETMRGHGAGPDTPIYYVSLACFNLCDEADLNELQTLIVGSGAGLVFIDAMADIMLGADENSVSDVQPVFHGLRRVAAATGAAIVLLHHANKAGGYRGSTALLGAVDLLLMVESKAESLNINFECAKARDFEPHKFAATAHFLPDMFNLAAMPAIAKGEYLSKSERYVMRYLEEHGDSPLTDIMDHADVCAPTTARSAVYALADKGRIERKDAGGPGRGAVYGLVQDDSDQE
jgi:hypothetical protein